MHPDFRDGLNAFREGQPFDPSRCGQWRRGWQAGQDGQERRAQGMSREAVETWRKDGPLPPARVVDLNAWTAQNREAEQAMLELRAFALSIGCTAVGRAIECTPEQASQLERWWIDHAPPAKPRTKSP